MNDCQKCGDLQVEVDRLTEQRDCLVDEVTKLSSKTFCAYCGDEFPLDTVTPTLIGEHIAKCPRHPMRRVEAERDEFREKSQALEAVRKSQETQLRDALLRIEELESQLEAVRKLASECAPTQCIPSFDRWRNKDLRAILGDTEVKGDKDV